MWYVLWKSSSTSLSADRAKSCTVPKLLQPQTSSGGGWQLHFPLQLKTKQPFKKSDTGRVKSVQQNPLLLTTFEQRHKIVWGNLRRRIKNNKSFLLPLNTSPRQIMTMNTVSHYSKCSLLHKKMNGQQGNRERKISTKRWTYNNTTPDSSH